jgi:hypothetical protein
MAKISQGAKSDIFPPERACKGIQHGEVCSICGRYQRTGLARYDLTATEKESAEQEARQYLERHQVIEVWSNDHRRVARLVRK